MELLEPMDLPSDDRSVAKFLLDVCMAVRTLHVHGFVHRDIKPQNIMRRKNGDCVLIDFGLAKKFAAGEPILGGASVTVMNGRAVGAGTPRYAAPEQFNGGDISPAADIHALGILANECFDGRPPRVWERIIGKANNNATE